MSGKVIAVVGDLGAGKTSFIKKYSKKTKADQTLVYLRISTDWENENVITFTNFEAFIRTANRKKNKLFVVDEAFTCLPKRLNIKMDKPLNINNQLADFLVNSRKMNNFIFIILHSLAQIPTEWLIPYLDYIVRFKTNDLIEYQARRFKSFPNIEQSLLKNPVVKDFKPVILKLR